MRTKYGMELIIDLHECDVSRFTKTNLDEFFLKLCEIAKMTPAKEPFYWKAPDGQPHLEGYSGVQFIMTSDIIIHTLDITKDAYINFFSCKDFNVPEVIAFMVDHFKVGFYHYSVLKRGHHRDPENREQEIEIKFSDKEEMRYYTWDDYFKQGDKMIFQILRKEREIYTRITLIHALIEQTLCTEKGITPDDVDKFDFWFENEYTCLIKEPGDHPRCPYREEHYFADMVDHMICKHLGIDFNDYLNS